MKWTVVSALLVGAFCAAGELTHIRKSDIPMYFKKSVESGEYFPYSDISNSETGRINLNNWPVDEVEVTPQEIVLHQMTTITKRTRLPRQMQPGTIWSILEDTDNLSSILNTPLLQQHCGSITVRSSRVDPSSQEVSLNLTLTQPSKHSVDIGATYRILEDGLGSQLEARLRVVPHSAEVGERRRLIACIKLLARVHLVELQSAVIDREGDEFSVRVDVPVDIDVVWNKISNWRDVSWITDATGARIVDHLKRRVRFQDGREAEEELVSVDNEAKRLVIQMHASEEMAKLGLLMARPSIQLHRLSGAMTRVDFHFKFISLPGANTQLVKKILKGKSVIEFQSLQRFKVLGGQYSTQVARIIYAPPDQVWEKVSQFGNLQEFCSHCRDVSLSGPDMIGVKRHMVVELGTRVQVVEELVDRRDTEMSMTYKVIEANPNTFLIKDTVVRINVYPVDGGRHSYITCDIHFDTPAFTMAGVVRSSLTQVYKAQIEAISRVLNPVVGTAEVFIKSGSELITPASRNPNPYVVVDIQGEAEQRSSLKFNTDTPVWGTRLTMPVRKTSTMLNFQVWSSRAQSGSQHPRSHTDLLLGVAFVDLSKQNLEQLGTRAAAQVYKLSLKPQGTLEVEVQYTPVRSTTKLEDTIASSTSTHLQKKATFMDQAKMVLENMVIGLTKMVGMVEIGDVGRWEFMSHTDSYGSSPLSRNLPALAKMVPSSELFSPRKIGKLFENIGNFINSQKGVLTRLTREPMDQYRALYDQEYLVKPGHVDNWKSDKEFCRYYLQGANPTQIEVVTDLTMIDPTFFRSGKVDRREMEDLIENRKLFMADYSSLLDVPMSGQNDNVFYAPQVLMYVDSAGELDLAAILLRPNRDSVKLTRVPGNTVPRTVVLTKKSPPNLYQFAKLHVANADQQVMQFQKHLAGHLWMEPLAVSHHNYLDDGTHIIGRLLKPHFRDTININYLARQTLISSTVPFTGVTFSTGSLGGLKLVSDKMASMTNFSQVYFPHVMQSKGFNQDEQDGLHDYYFRTDAYRLWTILEDYVTNVVNQGYPTDAHVMRDEALQLFVKSVSDRRQGNVRGFPSKIKTKSFLIDVLTQIIFTASVEHQSLNAPQWDSFSYVQARPASLTEWLPETEGDITWDWVQKRALPDMDRAKFQFGFAHLLSLQSEHTLSELDVFSGDLPRVQERLRQQLDTLSRDIRKRNAALESEGRPTYPYLDPRLVAASIDI